MLRQVVCVQSKTKSLLHFFQGCLHHFNISMAHKEMKTCHNEAFFSPPQRIELHPICLLAGWLVGKLPALVVVFRFGTKRTRQNETFFSLLPHKQELIR